MVIKDPVSREKQPFFRPGDISHYRDEGREQNENEGETRRKRETNVSETGSVARRFYRDVLGFEIREEENTENVYLVKDGTRIEKYTRKPAQKGGLRVAIFNRTKTVPL